MVERRWWGGYVLTLGHPALRLLARRKFSGVLRKQFRRLKTVKGAMFAIVGLGAIIVWVGAVVANSLFGSTYSEQSHTSPEMARLVGTAIAVMSLFGALTFRGLYLPREEIELLFVAPVSRGEVIRYRLWTALGKSLFGACFFALVVMGRVSVPIFGFLGAFVAMMTVPLLSQLASLLAGDAENRWIKRFPKGVLRAVNVAGLLLILGLIFLPEHGEPDEGSAGTFQDLATRLPALPVIRALAMPAWPWATMALSDSALEFFPLLLLCLGIWCCLFEACARISIDYRELSLETSADVARRLSRLRTGSVGAAGSKASASSAGWRVPWLFGRGPFGALAWRKTGTILRKARGTLLISGAMVLGLVVVTLIMFDGDSEHSALGSSVLIASAGTIYLCAGLRFDFREDLDRMDVVRSWPIAPWRVFLAAILPEAVLVFGLLSVAILVRSSIAGDVSLEVLAVMASTGPCVLGWIAIDNIVFLIWPQRITPGSEVLLQQAGRSLMLMLLRVLSVATVGGVVFGGAAAVNFLLLWLRVAENVAMGAAVVVGLAILVALNTLLVLLGGKVLSRFDFARDR